MGENVLSLEPGTEQKARWPIMIVAVVICFALLAGWWRLAGNDIGKSSYPEIMSPAEFEAETGVRVTLVAVTGAGGFIDFRVKVLDVEKAAALFADPANIPVLVVEESRTRLQLPEQKGFEGKFEQDRAYYLLYPNVDGVVETGTAVSILIGDYHHEAVEALGGANHNK
jgi:hypothetical protein